MKTNALHLTLASTLVLLPLLTGAADRAAERGATAVSAPRPTPVAHRANGCDAVLRDTRHPRFAECLAAAYKAYLAQPAR
jgi:hypothetical protein